MKKVIAMLLALVMILSMTACTGNTNNTNGNNQNEDNPTDEQGGTSVGADGTVTTEYSEADVEVDEELPHYNILVTYAQFTDKLGSQFKASLEYLAEPLNITFTFVESGMGDDESLSIIQSALTNDYDGAIGIGCNEGYLALYQDAGVPYVVSGGMPSTPELAATLAANYDMYLGAVVVDDYQAMVEGVNSLYEAGCRNVIWNGLQRGLSGQHDERTNGFLDAVQSYEDMNLISENYDHTMWADFIATTASTHPEFDGVGCSALSEAIYNTVVSEGLADQIKVAGIDISEGTGAAFEAGYLTYIAGGNYVTEMIAFAVLYNYLLDGTRIIEDAAVNLVWNNINITDIDEYNDYIKYLDSGIPAYTAQEILEMTHWYNEDFDAEAMVAAGKAFTLEDVIARHEHLFSE